MTTYSRQLSEAIPPCFAIFDLFRNVALSIQKCSLGKSVCLATKGLREKKTSLQKKSFQHSPDSQTNCSHFFFLQQKSSFSTWFSMLLSLASSPLFLPCSTRHWTRVNRSGCSTMAWSARIPDLVSDQCPQSRTSRAPSCGSRRLTIRTQTTGLELWMSSWRVSCRPRNNCERNFIQTFYCSLRQQNPRWGEEPRRLLNRLTTSERKSVSRWSNERFWHLHKIAELRIQQSIAMRLLKT